MVVSRRLGTETSATRTALLDATEQLMLDAGYAAVSSRRVAAAAGVRPALVHYYFRTMEELFLEVFRRRAEEGLEVQAQALQSPQPLWALWRFGTDPAFTRISMEFMALANHRKELRAEIAYYAERFREEQRQAVTAALQRYGVNNREDGEDVPPVVWTVLMTSLSRFLVLEQAVGISGGHAETMELVERYLRRLEGEPQPIAGMPQAWVVHQFRIEQSTPLGPSLDTATVPSTDRSQ